MEHEELGLESGKNATTSTISRLVLEMCDGLQRANDALLALADLRPFADLRDSLREDAERVRECRGDFFDTFMQTWASVAFEEAAKLRRKRRVREELERQADEDFLKS